MSIVASGLTKIYGDQKALDDISFEIHEGQIVGLLGPNGAGKTTTMKIITGFMPASAGEVAVYGEKVGPGAKKVKQMIGYLPEHNPLYLDMYVKEYLGLVANIHNLKNKKERVVEVIEMTGLEKEAHKKIRMLSKGYRQRVGLAQAIIHDPKILILDEPTSGLDPNQLIDIRSLIKTLGKDRIVIFSSHIMQEVEALCDRAIILNNGNLVADDALDQLTTPEERRTQTIIIELEKSMSVLDLEKLGFIDSVQSLGQNKFVVRSSQSSDIRPLLFDQIVKLENRLLGMEAAQKDISTVFESLTKSDSND